MGRVEGLFFRYPGWISFLMAVVGSLLGALLFNSGEVTGEATFWSILGVLLTFMVGGGILGFWVSTPIWDFSLKVKAGVFDAELQQEHRARLAQARKDRQRFVEYNRQVEIEAGIRPPPKKSEFQAPVWEEFPQ
jgi:hypothetical protein